MNSYLIAIPSAMPGGMGAAMGMHFGHCDIYTIVKVEDNTVKDVSTLENIPHQQGGCMAPVQHLANNGVSKILAGGMGMRPLMGFQQVGIDAYFAGDYPTVGTAVEAFLTGKLAPFSTDNTCSGH